MALQWLSLVGTIWIQSLSATNTNFPAYSSDLELLLSLSQLQLNNLAFASDAGKLSGFVSGVVALYLPLWLVLIIGSALGFIGYGVQYLFLHLLDQHGLLRNRDRQLAVGLSTSYQGLSAKIYSDLVDVVFKSSSPVQRARSYLLLNCILPLVVCFIASPLIREIKTARSKRLSCGFLVIFVITIFTGTFAVVTSLGSRKRLIPPLVILIGKFVFLVAPLVVPLMEKLREKMDKNCMIRSYGMRVSDESNIEEESGGVVNEHEVRDEGVFVCDNEEMGFKSLVGVQILLLWCHWLLLSVSLVASFLRFWTTISQDPREIVLHMHIEYGIQLLIWNIRVENNPDLSLI
ncbi:hypothetical protein L1987_85999 [Smallanthus sonchifolius]|uniref:Uncharacterized protein n=1 Tax=Smallanthus sonchifolius TaxID=185202 RepID=A0ACB8XYS8_9ASTR|nr:hypothetical protein L1987_85999 [Smallanthus sonchifolius]